MLKSVVEEYPQDDINISVVWVPMLASDNEDAAREISSMFRGDARVHQYWDPDRLSGTSYLRDVFPTYLKDMVASLPPDGPLCQVLKGRGDVPPENAPHWDVAFLYKPGTEWNDKPPNPSGFTKQLMFFGEQEDGTTGRFFTNDYKKPPRNTDWFVELSSGMKQMTKREPTRKPGPTKPAATVAILPGCCQGGGVTASGSQKGDAPPARFPNTIAGRLAKDFIEAFNSGNDEAMKRFEQEHRAESALAARSMDERLEQYRGLHEDWGKLDVHKITEKTERDISVAVLPSDNSMALELTFELEDAPSEKLTGIRIVPTILNTERRPEASAPVTGSEGSVEVTLLADSIEPLRERFNANKDKHRFIAILSPT